MDFECGHTQITNDICLECGLYLEDEISIPESSKFTSKMNNETKIRLIDTLDNDQELKKHISVLTSEHIHLNGKNIRDDPKNTFLLYYRACLRKGEVFNPLPVVKSLGIKKKQFNWMLKELTNTTLNGKNIYDKDSTPLVVVLPPSIFISKELCKLNNLEDEDYYKLLEICDDICEKNDYLNSLKPQYVSKAILKCYMEKKKMSCKGFSKRNDVSDMSIKKCKEIITQYFKGEMVVEDISTDINIVPEKKYISSTLTVTASLNTTVDLVNIVKFLPIHNLFKDNQRIKCDPGDKIPYYGTNNLIVSICYKNIIRGIRTTAMNNMLSLDYQISGKSVHVKVSKNEICCVGAKTNEVAESIFNNLVENLNEVQANILYLRENIETAKKTKKSIIKRIVKEGQKLKLSSVPEGNEKIIMIYLKYIEDYNTPEEFSAFLDELLESQNLFEGKLDIINLDASNSVYHSSLFNNEANLPLHKIATFFNEKGINSIFHNWCSDDINICFMVEDKNKNNHKKNYFHRFTIHEKGTIKQTSACLDRAECYKYYKKVIEVLKEAIEEINE